MLLISQIMATYDEMWCRAISQKTLGMKVGRVAAESGVLRKKEEAGAKGKRGECKGNDSESEWTAWEQKRLCAVQMKSGLYIFHSNNP